MIGEDAASTPSPARDDDAGNDGVGRDSGSGRQHAGGHAAKVLPEGRHFTLRGVAVGLLIGLVICFSNMYFGLQTGWISMMTMPASLMGFGIFRLLARHLDFPFSPVENVLVQSVAGGMAVVPLGCGFVGVVSALCFLGLLVCLLSWICILPGRVLTYMVVE